MRRINGVFTITRFTRTRRINGLFTITMRRRINGVLTISKRIIGLNNKNKKN